MKAAIEGPILALDLAVRAGFAFGAAGEHPWSGAVRLKKPDEGQHVAFSNLIAWLDDTIVERRAALVVKEAMLPLQAFKVLGNAEKTVRLHAGLHAITEGLCGRHGVPWADVPDGTVRKHFIGRGRMGSRPEVKAAVVARCHLLGLMPSDCRDEDRADALAIHDWACATWARRSTSTGTLFLFGEKGAA